MLKIIFFLTKIKKFVKINKNSILINSMGRSIYFSILNIIDCMIGNSSSGVLETPKFKLPVINIGNRQTGRFQNKNIINLDSNFRVQNIKKKLYQATSKSFKKKISKIKDLNYKGNTSLKILKILKSVNLKKTKTKKFYDVKF